MNMRNLMLAGMTAFSVPLADLALAGTGKEDISNRIETGAAGVPLVAGTVIEVLGAVDNVLPSGGGGNCY